MESGLARENERQRKVNICTEYWECARGIVGLCDSLVIGSPPLFLFLVLVDLVLMPDAPQTAADANDGGEEGHPVSGLVAIIANETFHVSILVTDRVGVVDAAVEDVEDVAGDDGREGHRTPVLAQAVDSEAVRHERRVYAEEHAVRDTCQSGDQDEKVRVGDEGGEDLDGAEDHRRHKEAPEP